MKFAPKNAKIKVCQEILFNAHKLEKLPLIDKWSNLAKNNLDMIFYENNILNNNFVNKNNVNFNYKASLRGNVNNNQIFRNTNNDLKGLNGMYYNQIKSNNA